MANNSSVALTKTEYSVETVAKVSHVPLLTFHSGTPALRPRESFGEAHAGSKLVDLGNRSLEPDTAIVEVDRLLVVSLKRVSDGPNHLVTMLEVANEKHYRSVAIDPAMDREFTRRVYPIEHVIETARAGLQGP